MDVIPIEAPSGLWSSESIVITSPLVMMSDVPSLRHSPSSAHPSSSHPASARRSSVYRPSVVHPSSSRRPSSVVRRPSSVVRRPSSVVRRPSSVVRRPSSAVRRPPSAVRRPSSVVRRPSSVVRRPSFARRSFIVLLSPTPSFVMSKFVLVYRLAHRCQNSLLQMYS